jgi:glutathione reductase (NADPH)
MSDFDYDLFVIGGGSGGVRAARMAAQTGARVALAEEYRLGGTCVIRGCVPKKLMVFASEYGEMVADARAYGWDIADGAFDWGRFRGQLDAELDRLEGVYRRLLEGSEVTVHDGRARVTGPHEVRVADTTISAKHILVATGGRPALPEMENAELGITSNDIFKLDALPESILIVGGGYIACEFACILHGLGVKVTQFYRGAQILRGFDGEARGLVAEEMRQRGVDLHLRPRARACGSRPPTAVSGSTTRSCSRPAARPTPTGWGWKRPAWSLAGGARWSWMSTRRRGCPRSMPSATSPTGCS